MVNIIQLQNKILPSQTPTQRDVDDKTKYSPHKLLHKEMLMTIVGEKNRSWLGTDTKLKALLENASIS